MSENRRPMHINLVPTRVSTIRAERAIYDNYPTFQRGKVWPKQRKQLFIEALLSGIPIQSLTFYPDKEQGRGKLWVLDGKQRLTTILGFLAGEFQTGRKRADSPEFGAFESNRSIDQLSSDATNALLGYELPLAIMSHYDEAMIRYAFLAYQNGVALSTGEKFFAKFNAFSDTRMVIASIMEHDFFNSIYKGGTERRQEFMMAAFPVLLEIGGGFADLGTDRLNVLAGGGYEDLIDGIMEDTIKDKLTYIMNAFDGVRSTSKNELIVMYQAVTFLALAGFDLNQMPTGALTSWYREVVPAVIAQRLAFSTAVSQMHKFAFQNVFWKEHLRDFQNMPDLVCVDTEKECHRNLERMALWIDNRHFCPACNINIPLSHIKLHRFVAGDTGKCPRPEVVREYGGPAALLDSITF